MIDQILVSVRVALRTSDFKSQLQITCRASFPPPFMNRPRPPPGQFLLSSLVFFSVFLSSTRTKDKTSKDGSHSFLSPIGESVLPSPPCTQEPQLHLPRATESRVAYIGWTLPLFSYPNNPPSTPTLSLSRKMIPQKRHAYNGTVKDAS